MLAIRRKLLSQSKLWRPKLILPLVSALVISVGYTVYLQVKTSRQGAKNEAQAALIKKQANTLKDRDATISDRTKIIHAQDELLNSILEGQGLPSFTKLKAEDIKVAIKELQILFNVYDISKIPKTFETLLTIYDRTTELRIQTVDPDSKLHHPAEVLSTNRGDSYSKSLTLSLLLNLVFPNSTRFICTIEEAAANEAENLAGQPVDGGAHKPDGGIGEIKLFNAHSADRFYVQFRLNALFPNGQSVDLSLFANQLVKRYSIDQEIADQRIDRIHIENVLTDHPDSKFYPVVTEIAGERIVRPDVHLEKQVGVPESAESFWLSLDPVLSVPGGTENISGPRSKVKWIIFPDTSALDVFDSDSVTSSIFSVSPK